MRLFLIGRLRLRLVTGLVSCDVVILDGMANWMQWFGDAILKYSPSYIHERPDTLPAQFPWPEKEEIVDSIAAIANLRWP